MSIKDKFNEEEWFLLMSLPPMIGAAMTGAAKSGVIGTVKETMANMKAIVGAKKDYPNNELINELLIKADSWDEAKEKAMKYREMALERIKSNGIENPEQLRTAMLEDCSTVNNLLNEKVTEEESSEYKKWVLDVAEKVAMAASEGGFLGFGGERVSEEEKKLLGDLKSSLEVV